MSGMMPAMTIRVAPALITLGLLLAVLGGIVGLSPINRMGTSCGSAFRPSDTALAADFTRAMEADAVGATSVDGGLSAVSDACASARSDRKPFALGGVVPGALLIVLGACLIARERNVEAERRTSQPIGQ